MFSVQGSAVFFAGGAGLQAHAKGSDQQVQLASVEEGRCATLERGDATWR